MIFTLGGRLGSLLCLHSSICMTVMWWEIWPSKLLDAWVVLGTEIFIASSYINEGVTQHDNGRGVIQSIVANCCFRKLSSDVTSRLARASWPDNFALSSTICNLPSLIIFVLVITTPAMTSCWSDRFCLRKKFSFIFCLFSFWLLLWVISGDGEKSHYRDKKCFQLEESSARSKKNARRNYVLGREKQS